MKSRSDIKIFIVGGGEIGRSLAGQLSRDGYELTLIDRNQDVVKSLSNSFDIICFEGNGASYTTLQELSAGKADIWIAVTESDELNILSCMTAHMMGAKHTIARIRDVDYARQNHFYKDKLGLSMIINPELATALAIVRDGEAFVPKGNTVISRGDILYMTGAADEFRKSFKKIKLPVKPLQSVMIAGGGRIAYYLAEAVLEQGAKVTLIEKNKVMATELSEAVEGINVVCDDALAYFDSMSQSDIENTDAFITITDNDEYNLVAAMYGESQGISKVISRIAAKSRLKVLPEGSKICTISREDVAADRILGYSRSLLNAEDNDAVESLYRLMDGRLEIIEFKVDDRDLNLNTPLKDLRMKQNMLIGCIIRDFRIIIPRGDDVILPGDTVLVAVIDRQIARLEDIFAS